MSNNFKFNAQIPDIPIFVGYYYEQWVEMMKKVLIGYGLWKYVENGYDESNVKMKEENMKNDEIALGCITLAVSPQILERIKHTAKAKQAWDILIRDFKGIPQAVPKREFSLFPPGSNRAKALATLTQATSLGKKVYDGITSLPGDSQTEGDTVKSANDTEGSTSEDISELQDTGTAVSDDGSFLADVGDMLSNLMELF